METPPPRWVRRLLVTPIVFVVAVAIAVISPLVHLWAAVLDLIFDRKRWRASRFVGVAMAFSVVEVFGLFTLLTVWIGSFFGRYMDRPFWVRANTLLLGQYMELITRAIRFFLGFSFDHTVEPTPTGPQLVFTRHAGPGDAFLVARFLIRDAGRRVHMIGAAKLQWDPFLDISGERLGFHYLHQNPVDAGADLARIHQLAESLEDDESLVIFPEGGNYTEGRRQRQIDRLVAKGRQDLVKRAEGLRHTLLPRAGGTLSAVEGAPDAVMLFVAHAGLEGLQGFGDLWAAVPLARAVKAHAWSAQPLPVDGDRAALAEWLHTEWQRVDDWIDDHLAATVIDLRQPERAPSPVTMNTDLKLG